MQALARVVAGLACARALTTPSASIGSTGVLGSTRDHRYSTRTDKKQPHIVHWVQVPPGRLGAVTSPTLSSSPATRRLSEAQAPAPCCDALVAIRSDTNLPVLVFYTDGQKIPDEPKVPVQLCACPAQGSSGSYEGPAGVEIRGSSSAREHVRKSWAVELRDSAGDDAKVPLLGFAKESDFALYAGETDRTLGVRNIVTMAVARAAGMWAPRTQPVDVFVVQNGGPDVDFQRHYRGLHVLMETIKRDGDRVEVSKASQEDPSGGFILKYDNNNIDAGDTTVRTPLTRLDMVVTYPRAKDITGEQAAWLESYLGRVEDVLFSGGWEGVAGGDAPLLDGAALATYFLVTELSKNPDGYRGSAFMHKDAGGPVRMGPPWDYNEAYGLCCGYPIEGYLDEGCSGPGVAGGSAISPEGWRFNICEDAERCVVEPGDGLSQWYRRLWQDPAFRLVVAEQWQVMRATGITDAAVATFLDALATLIAPAAQRTYDRFGGVARPLSATTWPAEMVEFRTWLQERLAWMDAELAAVAADAAVGT